MKKSSGFIVCLLLLSSCAPEPQRQVFISNQQQMGEVRESCIKSTSQDANPHEASVYCRFSAYDSLLTDAGFQDIDMLDVLKNYYLDIAKRQDSKEVTDKQADMLYEQANRKFNKFVAMRDDARSQDHQETMAGMAAFGAGMQGLSAGMNSMSNAYQARADAYGSMAASNQSTIQMGNQMVQQAQQDQLVEQQRKQTEQQQEQINQLQLQQDRFNNMSPAERMTYGHN